METEFKENLLPKTFFWMFLGLIGSAIMAWFTYSSGLCYEMASEGTFSILLIVELVVVLVFSFLFRKLSPTVVGIVYFVYAMINGMSLSTIFYIYDLNSIVYVFLATAALFGGLAFYGYKTNADLSNWRTVLYATLLVGIIFSLINLFVGNTMLDIILSWVMLFVFFGLTIYDMNKLKQLQYEGAFEDKLHIYMAMELYLDFINIFLRILRLFAKSRD